MATTAFGSFGAEQHAEKRPAFTVEYLNDELPQLTDQEREHRRHQFKVRLFFFFLVTSFPHLITFIGLIWLRIVQRVFTRVLSPRGALLAFVASRTPPPPEHPSCSFPQSRPIAQCAAARTSLKAHTIGRVLAPLPQACVSRNQCTVGGRLRSLVWFDFVVVSFQKKLTFSRPGHFDSLMLNVATLAAVFWAPEYFLWTDYLRQRGADPTKHAAHLAV